MALCALLSVCLHTYASSLVHDELNVFKTGDDAGRVISAPSASLSLSAVVVLFVEDSSSCCWTFLFPLRVWMCDRARLIDQGEKFPKRFLCFWGKGWARCGWIVIGCTEKTRTPRHICRERWRRRWRCWAVHRQQRIPVVQPPSFTKVDIKEASPLRSRSHYSAVLHPRELFELCRWWWRGPSPCSSSSPSP